MGFTVEAGKEKKEEHAVSGKYQKVAVDCWFTSTGRVMPKLIKYMDEEGCLQTLPGYPYYQKGPEALCGDLLSEI